MSSSVRPYYVFTAVVLGLGAVLSVIAESWTSFFVFSVLCGMAVWISTRVGRTPTGSAPQPAAGEGRLRPSERRRRRKS